jgi:hypothetical protein
MKTKRLVPLLEIVRRLVDNAGLTLAETNALPDVLSKAARAYGAQPGEIYIVEVADDDKTTYDIGFADPDPESRGELITLKQALASTWQPHNAVPALASRATKKADPNAGPSFSASVFTE